MVPQVVKARFSLLMRAVQALPHQSSKLFREVISPCSSGGKLTRYNLRTRMATRTCTSIPRSNPWLNLILTFRMKSFCHQLIGKAAWRQGDSNASSQSSMKSMKHSWKMTRTCMRGARNCCISMELLRLIMKASTRLLITSRLPLRASSLSRCRPGPTLKKPSFLISFKTNARSSPPSTTTSYTTSPMMWTTLRREAISYKFNNRFRRPAKD